MENSPNIDTIIDKLRKLGNKPPETDLKSVVENINQEFSKQAHTAKKRELIRIIFDVRDRGYTGEAALVRRGLLDISEISEESLDNFTERLQHENKDINFFGAGSLSSRKPLDEKRDEITDRAANAGVDAAEKATSRPLTNADISVHNRSRRPYPSNLQM